MNQAHSDAEARLRLALEAARIGFWEFDTATGKLAWDARVREVVEAAGDLEPTWGDHFLPALHPEDAARVQAVFAEALSSPCGDFDVEFRVVGARTGRITWAALHGSRAEGPAGPRLLGVARDITAEREGQAQAQARLAATVAERRLWADIVEASPDPTAAVDLDLNLVALNPAYVEVCQRLFGVTFRIGDNVGAALAHMPQARDASEQLWRHALAGNAFEIPASREAGEEGRYYELRLSPLRGAAGDIIGAFQVSRDVTARVTAQKALKQAERALQQSQKMEAIGNLTGGIAHDFNNLLQVIGGNLQLLGRDVVGKVRAELRVGMAHQAVTRGAKLTSQLLAFGRRQALEPQVVNVGRLIIGMDELLRRTLGEAVEIETSVSGGLWNAFVDATQLESAILNLAINARDAMEARGQMTIEVANAVLDDAYARANPEVKAGQYVMLAVSDTGCGMTPETLQRVFEPFFTTKPEGKGTGLGLSMVYGFVKQSEGHIKIYSEPDHGTTIRLYLPRAFAAEATETAAEPGAPAAGGARILVVEDDAQVRETTVALLTDLGYRVTQADHAAAALALLEGGVEVDLVFTDVVMPGPIRSVEMAARIREIMPAVRVLFTSGYTRNAIVHGGRLDHGVDLLAKPYTQETLAAKIAEVLG